jgi:hypothetical protein
MFVRRQAIIGVRTLGAVGAAAPTEASRGRQNYQNCIFEILKSADFMLPIFILILTKYNDSKKKIKEMLSCTHSYILILYIVGLSYML